MGRPHLPGPGTDVRCAEGGVGAQLSFALYGAANRLIRLHTPFLEPLGLTFPQFLVILELLDGAPRTVGDLCKRLGMDTGTLTPLLKRLQKAGRVTRTRDLTDERRVLIDLTDASRSMADEVRAVTASIRTACRLRDDDIDDLHCMLVGLAHPAEN